LVKMSKEVIEFIRNTRPGYIGTVSKNGVPNVAPKGSMSVIDEETLLFADISPGKTRDNIAENPNVTVAFVDAKGYKGYQIKGRAQSMKSGKVYEETCARIAALPMKLPKPEAAILIKVQEIYSLSPGPDAGKRI